MGKSSRLEMLSRRRDMLRYDRLGLTANEFCVKVASKYGLNKAAVLRDWSKRKEWLKTFCAEENNRSLAYELALDYERDCEEVSSLIEKEKSTASLIQLYYLKERLRDRRMAFLFKLGAFDSLRCDFEIQAHDHEIQLFEARYPWVVGNRLLCNSVMALEKLRGKLSVAELAEFESMFYSLFKGKSFVKPSISLARQKLARGDLKDKIRFKRY